MPNGHQSPRGPVPIQDVIKKTLSGIAKAQRDYEAWSGGYYWLCEAPEYMLTMYIAKELWTIPGSKYLTLESNVRKTLKDAGGMGRGKTSDAVRQGGRSDIVLWWSKDMPRAVIEAKNQVSDSAAEIEQDIIRISTMLRNKENSFQCGLIAFYTSRWDREGDGKGARSTIKDRLKSIECETRNILGEERRLSRHDSRIRVDGDSAWVASVLQIQRAS